MNKIKILPLVEAQKIAAGEVVERPASVVKELVENSLDAGADQISLYIEKAGKTLIRVIDNGFGMSLEDAKLSILPHATSKISTLNDLETIQTFGFRGEALATISAVSRFELITKQKENISGHQLIYENGQLLEENQVSISDGTQVNAKDLFFNTPVRKKFLKQDETEWNQIESLFHAFCFSHFKVHFKLFKDNKSILNAPAVENLKDRITQIYENNFAQNLIEITPQTNLKDIQISGLISNHQTWFYNKSKILFFVNNRFVKNLGLSKALLKGYLNVLPEGRFPSAFIFIKLNSNQIDVNVHPRKEEVKFSKPLVIENIIYEAVKSSLENNISMQISMKPKSINFGEISNFNFEKQPFDFEAEDSEQKKHNNEFNNFFNSKIVLEKSIAAEIKPQIDLKSEANKLENNFQENIYKDESILEIKINERIIGQLLNTYILVENENGLVLIDQHAAHERILYEKFKKNFFKQEGTKLLFPELISLNTHQKLILLQNQESLMSYGIEIEDFGDNVLAIKSSPPILKNGSIINVVLEIANIIEENENLEKEKQRKIICEKVHAMMSCKAAIKAGDVLNHEQMKQLLKDLNECENRLICVHGRPTIWSISKNQLEKTFQRKL